MPLGAAIFITLFTLHYKNISSFISIGAILAGFVLTIVFIQANGWQPSTSESVRQWLSIDGLTIDFGLKLDPLSLMMMLIVTGVGGAIHVYSRGYMHDDSSVSPVFRQTESIHLFHAWNRDGK